MQCRDNASSNASSERRQSNDTALRMPTLKGCWWNWATPMVTTPTPPMLKRSLVETTPEFRCALLRLYQLRNFNTVFCVIADGAKQTLFERRLQEEPFHNTRSGPLPLHRGSAEHLPVESAACRGRSLIFRWSVVSPLVNGGWGAKPKKQ